MFQCLGNDLIEIRSNEISVTFDITSNLVVEVVKDSGNPGNRFNSLHIHILIHQT